MNQKERSRLFVAGGASVALNLFIWLAVSHGFSSPKPALDVPPAEIASLSAPGDGQVIPKVIGKGTGVDTKEIAGVPMSIPAAEELKKLANMPQVEPLNEGEVNSDETERTRREVERTMRDFGYKSRTYDDGGGSGYDYTQPEVQIITRPAPPAAQQASTASGAQPSFGPNSEPIPIAFADAYLPDRLKRMPHKNEVKVRFDVAEDGKTQVFLESSTGVDEIDSLVVTSLKLWKWRPAHKDGRPYAKSITTVYRFPT